MTALFYNKRAMSLIRGGITLLIVSIMISIFTIFPLGTQAQKSIRGQRASTSPRLGTSKTVFSDFCYSFWTTGSHSQGLSCLKSSKRAMTLLKREMSEDNFAKWPQQLSLSDLASQGLLINQQTLASIKTQQDFLAAIPSTNKDLLTLFNGSQGDQLLSALWTYHLTNADAPPPPPPTLQASDAPPSCPDNSQSFQHSEVWPALGPMLITATDQSVQDTNNAHIGTFNVYGRLLLEDHCSIANLIGTTQVNGQPIKLNGQLKPSADQISQWERDTLANVANNNSSNDALAKAIFCTEALTDNTLVDSWFSAAVITFPTTSLTSSTAPLTTSSTAPSATPGTSGQPSSHVEVS
jgi:hypothetical protein